MLNCGRADAMIVVSHILDQQIDIDQYQRKQKQIIDANEPYIDIYLVVYHRH